jgi:hypothetical protein
MATAVELQQAQTALAEAQSRMQQLAGTVDLRERALHGQIKTDDIASAQRKLELTAQLYQAERELALAKLRVVETRRRVALGTGADVDLKRAELEVAEQELMLTRLQQQLSALGSVKK